jgi:DNA mismatch repair ATPase MutS
VKAHLLYRDDDLDLTRPLPSHTDDLVRDLELATLVRAMAGRDEFIAQVALRVLVMSLAEPEAIRYRQSVLQDFLRQPQILRELYEIVVSALGARRRLWGYAWSNRRPEPVLSAARQHLEMYLDKLKALRAVADKYRSMVGSKGLDNLFGSLQEDLSDAYLADVAAQLKRLHFPEGLLLSANLYKDNTGSNYFLRVPERDRPGWKERLRMAPRTTYTFSLPPRDEAGFQALGELRDRGLNEVANAVAQAADHLTDYFTMLRSELGFYAGCLNLARRLAKTDQPTCIPAVESMTTPTLTFADLRDTCLALHPTSAVVGNEVAADGKTLIVITGANSGGKSTFLRSLGLAQLMAQAGMFVTATSYRTSVVEGVFTHFLREEDFSMTRGRLEEELQRMSDLVNGIRTASLVLFNESFHSTNEREGSEIARQVVQALRDAGNRVAFVSHQYDFSRSFLDDSDSSTLFLRAGLGPEGKPDYLLRRGPPLSTAFGPELYREVFAGDEG